jgi:hypothetical protein
MGNRPAPDPEITNGRPRERRCGYFFCTALVKISPIIADGNYVPAASRRRVFSTKLPANIHPNNSGWRLCRAPLSPALIICRRTCRPAARLVYFEDEPRRRLAAKLLERDEALTDREHPAAWRCWLQSVTPPSCFPLRLSFISTRSRRTHKSSANHTESEPESSRRYMRSHR